MKGVIITLFFIAVCAGCTNKTKVPKDILSKDKMGKVMWDLMQVDAYTQNYLRRDTLKSYKKERTILYQQVFDLHKITRQEFNKSFDYYMGRPDFTQTIVDTLTARQTRHSEEERRLKDSARVKAERRAKLIKDSTRKDTISIQKIKHLTKKQ